MSSYRSLFIAAGWSQASGGEVFCEGGVGEKEEKRRAAAPIFSVGGIKTKRRRKYGYRASSGDA